MHRFAHLRTDEVTNHPSVLISPADRPAFVDTTGHLPIRNDRRKADSTYAMNELVLCD